MKAEEMAVGADCKPGLGRPFYRPAEGELSAEELSLRHRHSQLPAIRASLIRTELKKVIDNFALDEGETLDALIEVFGSYTRKFVNGVAQKASENRNYSHRRRSKA
jgi:hypothetical protein